MKSSIMKFSRRSEMWQTKVFKTKEKMIAFLEKNQNIQYRKLNSVY